MGDNPADFGRHLTDEEMAVLIEAKGGGGSERLWEHLGSCDHCFAAYQEAALCRGLWESRSVVSSQTAELISVGMGVAAGGSTPGAARRASIRDEGGARFWGGLRFAPAVVAAVLLVWVLLGNLSVPTPQSDARSTLAPVIRAIGEVTRRGSFVLPGGEAAISDANGVFYRSGYLSLDDSLKTALGRLLETYRQGDHSIDLMYWLVAGYLATGQLRTARDIVMHARTLGVTDHRMTIAEAIIAFASGDGMQAELLLRDVIRADAGNCIAKVNLAVVLMQRDEMGEAGRILRNVADACGDPRLRARARSLLKQNS